MSKRDKLIERLMKKPTPKNVTYDEVVSLLGKLGYEVDNKGKTSGSRIKVKSKNTSNGYDLRIHRPHPNKELKKYQVDEVLDFLRKEGIL